MNEMTINFNEQSYIAKYNKETGYYEVNLKAPDQGGIYEADISFTDLYEQDYEDTQIIQIWAKEKIKIEQQMRKEELSSEKSKKKNRYREER